MPIFTAAIPLSLYIHIPWCVRKCPYCDFNSHQMKGSLPEEIYVAALLDDLEQNHHLIQDRTIRTIFFGGGTPSLFSGEAIERILKGIADRVTLDTQIEITLEANPGTVDQVRFRDFRQAGINRLSLGIQSLQNDKLKALGRIHDSESAMQAITIAKEAGFDNFNLDLMYGLPDQSIEDALQDITMALHFAPTHLSWYQLTIEPNTFFHHQPPPLPTDDITWEMAQAGLSLLTKSGFEQYEVSAYTKNNQPCKHNLNYWKYGDYLGIGAGAHSKMTDKSSGNILRFSQVKNPRDYLDRDKRHAIQMNKITAEECIFEFMLNALRLTNGIPSSLFSARTGLSLDHLAAKLMTAKQRGLLSDDPTFIRPTELGRRFLNDLVEMFLP